MRTLVLKLPSTPPLWQRKRGETGRRSAGYWKVKDGGWVWEAGHYVEKPNVAAVWIPGRWVNHGWGSTWVEGHWE